MKTTTICFLVKGDQVLLAMKKRGFGQGKWNGAGGKMSEGETPARAAIREVKEEIDVEVRETDLVPRGQIRFSFKEHSDWEQTCHVFVAHRWSGEPRETEEMRPAWFDRNALPFDEMWIDDPHWLPSVLDGKTVEAEFLFDGEGGAIDRKSVRLIVARIARP